jgi:hypothetical protein
MSRGLAGCWNGPMKNWGILQRFFTAYTEISRLFDRSCQVFNREIRIRLLSINAEGRKTTDPVPGSDPD